MIPIKYKFRILINAGCKISLFQKFNKINVKLVKLLCIYIILCKVNYFIYIDKITFIRNILIYKYIKCQKFPKNF